MKLKRCPFCGGEAIRGIACHVHEDYAFRVECRECKIVTPFYDTEAEAIEAWNRRADDHFREVTKMVERTAKVVEHDASVTDTDGYKYHRSEYLCGACKKSDLISRQDAIDAINHICPIDTEYDCALLDRVDVRYVLSDLPSAEPERKKGEWVYDGKRGRFPACKCSICGHYENADWAMLQGVNFCPHCGADMRGEQDG